MSGVYITVDPKTLECIEVGAVDADRLIEAISEGLVIFPATRAGARQAFGAKFESLDHAMKEASKQ